ncbi:MAG: hypothetical protein H6726_06980 [Sandaracinaceae bacterium]|nr:hypothetical protein [Myxococcales bacterium]MCB9657382.1 hypothetical protein [Sandaracinaceae bacterium]
MLQERRQQRTNERDAALRYQLEHSRARGGLEALVLADQQGMVVASAGAAEVCEELGAIAPLMTRSVMGMPLPPLLRGGEVVVRPLRLYGQDLYLACIGGGVARDALMSNSVTGVQRILSAN